MAAVALFLLLLSSRSTSVPAQTGTAPGNLPSVLAPSGANTTGGSNSGAAGSPITGNAPSNGASAVQFGIVSDEPVLDYFVGAKNDVTVIEPDGKIAGITAGQVAFLSSAEIQGLLGASFSFDGAKVLVNFGDQRSPQTSIFDLATKAWTPLPEGIVSPVWSPSDYRIAYFKNNPDGTQTLATLDVSKTAANPSFLLTIGMSDFSLLWPNKTRLVLCDKPSAYAQESAWLFDLQAKTLAAIPSGNYGLETAWSNTTSSMGLIFSSPSLGNSGGILSLWSPGAAGLQDLNFLTLPSKCVFNYETVATSSIVASSTATSSYAAMPYLALYCAVPQNQNKFASAHLPDDYEQLSFFTTDDFYRIHTDTGAVDNIFSPVQSIDATDLRVFNKTLFFVNRYDQKLYGLSLGTSTAAQ